jgi:hypothetical protein
LPVLNEDGGPDGLGVISVALGPPGGHWCLHGPGSLDLLATIGPPGGQLLAPAGLASPGMLPPSKLNRLSANNNDFSMSSFHY